MICFEGRHIVPTCTRSLGEKPPRSYLLQRENWAGWPERNKTQCCARSLGTACLLGGAALASAPASAGAGTWPPATSASFPEEFHFLWPGPQQCGGGGGWFLRMTPLVCCVSAFAHFVVMETNSILTALERPTRPQEMIPALTTQETTDCMGCWVKETFALGWNGGEGAEGPISVL